MVDTTRVGIARALVEGLGLVRGATRYLLLAYAASLALALPLAAALASTLERSLGRSEAGERMRDGFDPLWHAGFAAHADGLGSTFDPGVVGIGAVLDGFDATGTGRLLFAHAAILGAGLIYLVVWVFLAAGLVARFCGRSDRTSFFAAAAHHFARFALLSALAAVLYAILLGPVLQGLGKMVEAVNRETIDERIHLAWVLGKYLFVWALVWLVAVVFDYAKVIAVVRDRPPVLRNLGAALSLVFRHKRQTLGLSASLVAVAIALTLAYWALAPGVGGGSWPAILWAFALGQAFLLARIGVRGWCWASQTVLARAISAAPRVRATASPSE